MQRGLYQSFNEKVKAGGVHEDAINLSKKTKGAATQGKCTHPGQRSTEEYKVVKIQQKKRQRGFHRDLIPLRDSKHKSMHEVKTH